MSRTFHVGDVLSITTGFLVSPRHMDGIYDLLDYMTGDNLFTHQLPRASTECAPALLKQHPQLAGVETPDEFEGKEHVERWLAEQVARFGEHLVVEPLATEDHTRIDPITEMRMLKPDAQIIPVVVDGSQS